MALLILVVILTMRFSGRAIKRETVTSLGKFLSVFIVVLLVLVFLDKITHFYPASREATIYMLSGRYSWIFWVFQIGMGAVIPLAILTRRGLNTSVGWIGLASLSTVIGVFFERYYLVIPGAAFPFPLYPEKIEGMWGALGSFPIEPVETVFSIGLLALVALLFVLGLKYLELLPANEEVLKEENSK
jgi:molybdopterin-containing oxidoreductase family membrane subunit